MCAFRRLATIFSSIFDRKLRLDILDNAVVAFPIQCELYVGNESEMQLRL